MYATTSTETFFSDVQPSRKGDRSMTTHARPIPEGFHTVTPGLVVRDAAKAIEFYKKALGAQELMRLPGPDGKIMHSELRIGDSVIFISDENPQMANVKSPQSLGGCTGTLNVYVPDVDGLFKQALAAGGKESMPDRKSTRLNSSHQIISYAVFCLKKKTERTLLTSNGEQFQQKNETRL